MRKIIRCLFISLVFISLVTLYSCDVEDEIPTKTKMEGVWKVVEAYDSSGNSIIDKIQLPIAAFYLSSDIPYYQQQAL